MYYLEQLVGWNPVLMMAILSWAVAQVLKAVIILVTERRFDWKRLTGSGGMPSSHSAAVCACAAATARLYGFSSPLFGIISVVACIVMYDASHVRREAGEQAKILNLMMEQWSKLRPELMGKQMKELLGHTPLQVFFGALLGGLLGWFGTPPLV